MQHIPCFLTTHWAMIFLDQTDKTNASTLFNKLCSQTFPLCNSKLLLDMCATKVEHSPFATISIMSMHTSWCICITQNTERTATQFCKANAVVHWKLMFFWCTKMQWRCQCAYGVSQRAYLFVYQRFPVWGWIDMDSPQFLSRGILIGLCVDGHACSDQAEVEESLI